MRSPLAMAMLTPFSASKCATGRPKRFFWVTYRFTTPRASMSGAPPAVSAPVAWVAGDGMAASNSCV